MAASGSNPPSGKDRISDSPSRTEAASPRRRCILIVEDSQPDLFLIREALEAAKIDAVLNVLPDGHQAVAFIDAADANPGARPCPDLMLLDLNLPRKGGAEVLRHLRKSKMCRDMLVLVVTSSDSASEREAVRAMGFSEYFRKPSSYEDFMKLGPVVRQLLARRAAI